MPIAIGTQLGSHEITALLGKGGMGEVYRARDLRLKREVAIKILPDEFARDGDRLSRFQREAEVLAALNHPNIAAIYDLAQAGDARFLVLELYVRPFPNVDGGPWQVPIGSVRGAAWSRNGKEIIFAAADKITTSTRFFSVPVQAASGFSFGNAQLLFEGDYGALSSKFYDVSADGKLLIFKSAPQPNATLSPSSIVVVLNWYRELQERAPLK